MIFFKKVDEGWRRRQEYALNQVSILFDNKV